MRILPQLKLLITALFVIGVLCLSAVALAKNKNTFLKLVAGPNFALEFKAEDPPAQLIVRPPDAPAITDQQKTD